MDDRQASAAIRRVVLAAMQVQSDLAHLRSHYPGNVLGCRKFESDCIAKKMRALAVSEAQLKLAIDCTSEEDLGLLGRLTHRHASPNPIRILCMVPYPIRIFVSRSTLHVTCSLQC